MEKRYIFIINENSIVSIEEYKADMPRIFTSQSQEIKTAQEMLSYCLDRTIDFSLMINEDIISINSLNSEYKIELSDTETVDILDININFKNKFILISMVYSIESISSIHYYRINNELLIDDLGEFDYYYKNVITEGKDFNKIITDSVRLLRIRGRFD